MTLATRHPHRARRSLVAIFVTLVASVAPAQAQEVDGAQRSVRPGETQGLRTRRGQAVGSIETRYASTLLLPKSAEPVALHGRWNVIASADGRTLLTYGDPLFRHVRNELTLAIHRDGERRYALERPWLPGSRCDMDERGVTAIVGASQGADAEARLISPDGREVFRRTLASGFAHRSVTVSGDAILTHRVDSGGRTGQSSVVRIDAEGEHELCRMTVPCELIVLEDLFLLREGEALQLHDLDSGHVRWRVPVGLGASGLQSWRAIPERDAVVALSRALLRPGERAGPTQLVVLSLNTGAVRSVHDVPGTATHLEDPSAYLGWDGTTLTVERGDARAAFAWANRLGPPLPLQLASTTTPPTLSAATQLTATPLAPQTPIIPRLREPVWPLASGDRDVMIDFGTIHLLSWLQGFEYSHKGVDLNGRQSNGQLGDQVVAMRSGTIVDFETAPIPLDSYVIVEVPLSGGGSEWDAYLHTLPGPLLAGAPVTAGTPLGVVSLGGCWSDRLSHHLHIARMNNWQLMWGQGETTPYDHMIDPLGMFTAPGDTDPFQRLPRLADVDSEPGDFRVVDAANPRGPGMAFAWGSVDLVCEIADSKSSILGWGQGLYALGYWIEALTPGGADVRSASSPYALCRMDDHWYDGYVIPHHLVSIDHSIDQGGSQLCWDMAFSYFLTHATSDTGLAVDVDFDQHWGTDASLASQAPNGSDNGSFAAREIQEARFVDGTYRVHCLLEDRIHQVDEARDVTVDNFRPYLRRVQIVGSSTIERYDAEWSWDAAAGVLRMTPLDLVAETVDFDEDEDITISLTFSEPVVTPSIGIVPPLASGFVPALTEVPGSGGTQWTGVVPRAQTSAAADPGLHRLAIRCVDTNDTPIIATSSPAPRPAFFGKRTSAAPIVDATSLDVLHRFGIRP